MPASPSSFVIHKRSCPLFRFVRYLFRSYTPQLRDPNFVPIGTAFGFLVYISVGGFFRFAICVL